MTIQLPDKQCMYAYLGGFAITPLKRAGDLVNKVILYRFAPAIFSYLKIKINSMRNIICKRLFPYKHVIHTEYRIHKFETSTLWV